MGLGGGLSPQFLENWSRDEWLRFSWRSSSSHPVRMMSLAWRMVRFFCKMFDDTLPETNIAFSSHLFKETIMSNYTWVSSAFFQRISPPLKKKHPAVVPSKFRGSKWRARRVGRSMNWTELCSGGVTSVDASSRRIFWGRVGLPASDLFGMMKTWPELKGCLGNERSRLESTGHLVFSPERPDFLKKRPVFEKEKDLPKLQCLKGSGR